METDIKPEHWNSAAGIVLRHIVNKAQHPSFASIGNLQTKIQVEFDAIVDGVFHSNPPMNENVMQGLFEDICAAALNGYAAELKVSAEEAGIQVLQTVIGKQRMYGHGNIARFEIPGITIRLNDKLERLKNLQKHDGPVLFEPINDTWLDICGYSVIALMWINRWFMLELAPESK